MHPGVTIAQMPKRPRSKGFLEHEFYGLQRRVAACCESVGTQLLMRCDEHLATLLNLNDLKGAPLVQKNPLTYPSHGSFQLLDELRCGTSLKQVSFGFWKTPPGVPFPLSLRSLHVCEGIEEATGIPSAKQQLKLVRNLSGVMFPAALLVAIRRRDTDHRGKSEATCRR